MSDEKIMRLYEAGMGGMWLVNTALVNIDDLLKMRPGMMVRCTNTESVKFIQAPTMGLEGCIAGWISDDE